MLVYSGGAGGGGSLAGCIWKGKVKSVVFVLH